MSHARTHEPRTHARRKATHVRRTHDAKRRKATHARRTHDAKRRSATQNDAKRRSATQSDARTTHARRKTTQCYAKRRKTTQCDAKRLMYGEHKAYVYTELFDICEVTECQKYSKLLKNSTFVKCVQVTPTCQSSKGM